MQLMGQQQRMWQSCASGAHSPGCHCEASSGGDEGRRRTWVGLEGSRWLACHGDPLGEDGQNHIETRVQRLGLRSRLHGARSAPHAS